MGVRQSAVMSNRQLCDTKLIKFFPQVKEGPMRTGAKLCIFATQAVSVLGGRLAIESTLLGLRINVQIILGFPAIGSYAVSTHARSAFSGCQMVSAYSVGVGYLQARLGVRGTSKTR